MSTASLEIHELARRLVVFESALDDRSSERLDGAVRVIEELRVLLVKLAGIHGFRSLLSRALTLAKAEVPALTMLQVRADGSLDGYDGLDSSQDAGAAAQAGILLVACFLELLVTFIGAPLTLKLLRDKWADASLDGTAGKTEDKL